MISKKMGTDPLEPDGKRVDGCVEKCSLAKGEGGELWGHIFNFLDKGHMVFFKTIAGRRRVGERERGPGLPLWNRY